MPLVSVGWNVVALVLCLAGFFFLVFANEREGRRLLRRPASGRERRVCAAAGGVLLFFALWVCVQEWRGTFGSVLWFGWLTVAALALIFALALGVRQEDAQKGHHRHGHGERHHKEAPHEEAPEGAALAAGDDAGKAESGPEAVPAGVEAAQESGQAADACSVRAT